MPNGKPAGVRCAQLGADNRCQVFGRPERPAFCAGLKPSAEMCGSSRGEALVWLRTLEEVTTPDEGPRQKGGSASNLLRRDNKVS